jgi:hypothetical protein
MIPSSSCPPRQLDQAGQTRPRAQTHCRSYTTPWGTIHQGVELAYRTFDKIQQVDQGAIADNKRLGPLLAMIREQQLRREPQHRSQRAPRRRDQRDARLFKVG